MRIEIPKYNTEEDRYNGWLSICKDVDSNEYLPLLEKNNNGELDLKLREQLRMDVKRAFNQYDFLTPEKVQRKRSQLEHLLTSFFILKPEMHYYQGLHDICGVLLLTLSEEDALQLLLSISETHLKDLLSSDFELIKKLTDMVLAIVKEADKGVYDILIALDIPPFFGLSWIITWFTHDIPSLRTSRLYMDFFLVNHPVTVLYAAASVILICGTDLRAKGRSGESDLHQWLKQAPSRISAALVMLTTQRLMRNIPLSRLDFPEKNSLRETVYFCGLDIDKDGPSLVERPEFWMATTVITVIAAIMIAHTFWNSSSK